MSSTTILPDSDVFPTASMPITIGLTSMFVFVIVAGFFSLFFWRCLLNRLFSIWTLQRTPYGDLIHVTTPPENAGLDPIIIRSFPVLRYSYATMKNRGTECAICLSEFSDKDTIRLITVCSHGFHSSCIDLWFELHKTCPVCRCELDPALLGSGRHESFHNTVTITIQDEENPPTIGSSKRLVEASAWRFSRSHSTGHFMVKMTDVNNVKTKRKHYHPGNCVAAFQENPPTTGSSKTLMGRLSRSHSTGHFMVKTTDVNVKIDGRRYQPGSCAIFDDHTWYGESAGYGMA